MTPDVNVLVAASRADHPQHAPARHWLEATVATAETAAPLALQPMVMASFLRLVTNPKIFSHPTPIESAVRFIDALLGIQGVTVPQLGDEWPIFRRLCLDKDLAANDLPDAWLAAAVIEQGEHLVTFDRDFKRLLLRGQYTRLAPA